MALPADEARLAFATRQAVACALTALVGEIFQTPEIALTVYMVFFLNRVDRASSLVANIVMTVFITIIISLVVLTTIMVIDQPAVRFASIGLLSFGFLFLASASKLRPIGAMVALIVGYALDMLGTAHAGEAAIRALLYAWLFIGIPAGVSVMVNLLFAPSPRRLIEKALAYRLRASARRLVGSDPRTLLVFRRCLEEGPGEVPAWLRLLGIEKTAPAQDLQALRRAADATIALLVLTNVATAESPGLLPQPVRERLRRLFEEMAGILESGHYPVAVDLEASEAEAALPDRAATLIVQLRLTLREFAEAGREGEATVQAAGTEPEKAAPGGFFLPDAFSNPEHLHYALKTTLAALFCYVLYSILDWPGIHTSFITCYIVALSTTAESVQKLTLRILGCVAGAVLGIATIVFVMPGLNFIGALLTVVFVGAFAAAWIAGGGPRISYAGFQVAFAFFLSVIQGPAPAFDMVVARDRVIGILLGIIISYGVSAYLWPVSVACRIDPGIGALLRRLSAAVTAPSTAVRRTVGAVALAGLRGVGQDLGLLSYEPRSLRPSSVWAQRRARTLERIAALVGPLLLVASSDGALGDKAGHRLAALADGLSRGHIEAPDLPASGAAEGPTQALWQWVEVPLVALEAAIAADMTTPPGEEHSPA